MNMLHVDSVTKSFNNKVILSDIFLSCLKGEILGLLGRNGSGKSTLLKIVFGSEKSENKFVRIGDKVIRNVYDGRNLINYLPQDNFLPSNSYVRNLIDLFLEAKQKRLLLENEYITPLLKKKYRNLSNGEKRLFEFLLIINSKAKFILLDEPFKGVSPILKSYIIEYLKTMKISKGIIVTDHDYENIIKQADRLVYLKDGYIKEVKDVKDLVLLGYISNKGYNQLNFNSKNNLN